MFWSIQHLYKCDPWLVSESLWAW